MAAPGANYHYNWSDDLVTKPGSLGKYSVITIKFGLAIVCTQYWRIIR
jgi:hypothetical protein